MSKIANVFAFAGKLKAGKDELKNVISGNWTGSDYRFSLINDDGTHFIKAFGGDMKKGAGFEDRVIKLDEDTEMTVAYADRHNAEILAKVPNRYKSVVKLLDGTYEFLYQNEFVEFIYAQISKWTDKFFKMRGRVNFSMSKDKKVTYKEFTPSYIEEITEEEYNKITNKSAMDLQLFYDSNCIDQELVGANGEVNVPYLTDMGKKVVAHVYVEQKNSDKKTKDAVPLYHIPLEITMDFSKYDFSIENHRKMAKLILRNFVVQGDNVYTSCWTLKDKNVQEKKEYTEEELNEMLTPEEKEAIEVFGMSMEQVIRNKTGESVYGERVRETKIIQPHPAMLFREVDETVTQMSFELYKTIGVEEEAQPVKKAEPKKAEPNKEGTLKEDDFAGLMD